MYKNLNTVRLLNNSPGYPTGRSEAALGMKEGTIKAYLIQPMCKVDVGNRIALSVHAALYSFVFNIVAASDPKNERPLL